MSIIHDALKKVQHSLDRNYGRSSKPAAPHEPLAPGLTNNPKPVNPASAWQAKNDPIAAKTVLWFAATVLVCVGVILVLALKVLDSGSTEGMERSALMDTRLQQRSQQMATFQSRQASAPSSAPAAAPAPKPAPAPEPVRVTAKTVPATASSAAASHELILGGIMVMGNERVALINDDVYAVGDTVDGKQITEITLKEVTLRDNSGALTTLKVLNRR